MCFLVCGPPLRTMVDNGNIAINDTTYTPGETLEYMCIDGHSTRHETVTQCQDDFTWSLDLNGFGPICVPGDIL